MQKKLGGGGPVGGGRVRVVVNEDLKLLCRGVQVRSGDGRGWGEGVAGYGGGVW